jgi:hypothetical protein
MLITVWVWSKQWFSTMLVLLSCGHMSFSFDFHVQTDHPLNPLETVNVLPLPKSGRKSLVAVSLAASCKAIFGA